MSSLAAALFISLSLQTVPSGALEVPLPTATLSDAYYYFLQGRQLESQSDVPGAIAAYKKALEIAPKAAELHAELAGVYARDGRAKDALDEGAAALALDATNREAHRILGLVQSALAEQQPLASGAALTMQAIGNLEQAVAGGLLDPGVLFTLGKLYIQTSKYPKAIETLTNFLLDQPGYPDAVLLLAEAYDNTGQFAQAIAQLEPLVADQPNQPRAQTWLAELYERSGRWKEAAAKWGTVVKQAPQTQEYRTREASALLNAGDLAGGRDVLRDVVQNAPRDLSSWYLLAQAERRLQNGDGAEDAARHIIAIDATDPRGPLAMAEAKAARKDFGGVVETLDPLYAALLKAPAQGNPLVFVASQLSAALEASGNVTRSLQVLEDARRAFPDDQDLVLDLAGAYEHSGKIAESEQVLRDVLAKDPANPGVLNFLGYVLADHGLKLDEAVVLIRRALAADADNPSYLDSLGWALFKQGKYPDAVPALERAAASSPQSSLILDHLGEVYFQTKRYREAADVWTRALAGDHTDIDIVALTRKRDRARELAK
jgi:tetratricopeptide (TPR) repeat protein